MPQANSTTSRPRVTSPSASESTLPCSAVMSAASSSLRALSSSRKANSTWVRLASDECRHSAKAVLGRGHRLVDHRRPWRSRPAGDRAGRGVVDVALALGDAAVRLAADPVGDLLGPGGSMVGRRVVASVPRGIAHVSGVMTAPAAHTPGPQLSPSRASGVEAEAEPVEGAQPQVAPAVRCGRRGRATSGSARCRPSAPARAGTAAAWCAPSRARSARCRRPSSRSSITSRAEPGGPDAEAGVAGDVGDPAVVRRAPERGRTGCRCRWRRPSGG